MNVIQLVVGALVGLGIVLLVLMLCMLLTGCSNTGEYAGDSPQGRAETDRPGSAIAFSVGDSTALTRTAQGTMTLDGSGSTVSLRDRGFGVFACHTGVHPYVSTSTTANLMYNQQVTYDGSASAWTYDPLVYWPNSDDGVPEFVTFFAYSPYSSNAKGCIADLSRPDEQGDPWILYQLGGTEDDWQSSQVDLLYDFQKDAVLAIINKSEKYNGCILADSVGLGKTFTALAVIIGFDPVAILFTVLTFPAVSFTQI